MIALFDHCIFCGAALPTTRTGEGEHIIPKSIMGFWASHDVCSDCILYFGQEVDRLAIKHVGLLEALKSLNISNPERLLEQIPWKGKHSDDGKEVQVVRKGSEYHIKVTQQDDFMECSDPLLKKIGKPWLWNKMRGKLSHDEFERGYETFLREYAKIKPDEIYHSKIFGFSFKKKRVSDVRPAQFQPEGFTRLLAKIALSFLHYSIAKDFLSQIEELPNLRDHARYGKALKEFTINPFHSRQKQPPQRFHSVTLYPDKGLSLLDIQLFGSFTWRIAIHTSSVLKVTGKNFQEPLELIQLVLDFRDLLKRQKLVALKPFGTDDFDWNYLDA